MQSKMAASLTKAARFIKRLQVSSVSQSYRVNTVWSREFRTSAACLGVKGTPVKMPSLSPTMQEGTIIKWYKQEGDEVAPGDVLCDIQTDKAVVAMEYEEEGILAKILKPDNSKDVKIGTLIALMVEEGEDWKDVEAPAGEDVVPSGGEEQEQAPVSAGGGVQGTIIKMPSLSPTMSEGTIVKWYKQEGDVVSPGDVLCDIQTDKAVVAMENDEEGILAKILKPDNSKDVKIGTIIAIMVEEGEDWKNVAIPSDDMAATSAPPSGAPEQPKSQTPAAVIADHGQASLGTHGDKVGPAVRTLVPLYGINLDKIRGSGPKGMAIKGDVLRYIKENNLKPLPPDQQDKQAVPTTEAPPPPPPPVQLPPVAIPEGQDYVDIPLSNMRKTIAKRLTESKTTIPHAYATIDCEMGNVMKVRKKMQDDGVKLSVNDFIIKAAAVALQRVPEVNAIWGGDAPKRVQEVDVAVAVATDQGLITPIVKGADGIGLVEISENVRELATKAKAGRLQPHEFQGGSFTISNLGMFGITEFSAVINPPQACILAIGSSRVLAAEDNTPKLVMTATLSSDARIVDETLALKFLENFRDNLQNPMFMTT